MPLRNTIFTIPLFVVLALAGSSAFAQYGYISLGAAFGFGRGGIMHQMFEESSIQGNEITVQAKRLTLGSGFNYRADFRFFPGEHLGIGIQGTLFRGERQHFSSERKIVFIQTTDRSVRARGFSVAAGLHLRMGEERLLPYISLFPGYFLGTLDLLDTVSYYGQVTTSQWEYQSLNSLFCNVAAGLDIMITKELVGFVEFEYQSMTIAPEQARLVVRNGSDDLEHIVMSEKVIMFMDQVTSDYTQVPDDSKPRKDLRPYFPLDSFQVRIGVRVSLIR